MTSALVLGYGLAGRGVVDALRRHGIAPIVVDDRPSESTLEAAAKADVELVAGPSESTLADLLGTADIFIPSPGVPDAHAAFALALDAGAQLTSEFDLAAEWDDRPILAITGTDGKTTVTTMVDQMMTAAGFKTIAAGNNDIPLVTAIADPSHDLFVVEASSFRLGHSSRFAPSVGTWLNFGPDHLDVHRSMEAYEQAKASIWARSGVDDVAIANAEDGAVMSHLPVQAVRRTFGLGTGDYRVDGDNLIAGDQVLLGRHELWRQLPHDLTNTLAAGATAIAGGASLEAVRDAAIAFRGLPHRVSLVGERDGVRFFNDSKATTPNAVAAAIAGFDSVVLIAGGRNKGLDLSPLVELRDHLTAVVAIGEAAQHVVEVFGPHAPTVEAETMRDAVSLAADRASVGDVVLLSPGCASFDWYSSYKARGDDFAAEVRHLIDGQGKAS